jgi:hypothetical protein
MIGVNMPASGNGPQAWRWLRGSVNRGASCVVEIQVAEQGRDPGRPAWRAAFRRAFRDGRGGGEHRELADQAVQDPGGLGGPGAPGGTRCHE